MIRKCSSMAISCGSTQVKAVDEVKYLGASLDQTMSGEFMADNVIPKSNSKMKFLYRIGKILSIHAKKLLVSALIQ